MRRSTSYLMGIALVFAVLFFLLSSCKKDTNDPAPVYDYTNVPDGGTAVIQDVDLSGQGLLTNRAHTTWIVRGHVKVDAISVVGKVIMAPGSYMEVNTSVNVAGGASLAVSGKLICTTLTQVGDVYYNEATVQISGQYTSAGGTNIYLQNSLVAVNDLRIQGSIYAIENEHTQSTNVFSVFYFNGTNLYLNRSSGTVVCGPVLFTYDSDQGNSGIALNDYTTQALAAKPGLRDVYGLPTVSFYRYADQGCTPLAAPPSPF